MKILIVDDAVFQREYNTDVILSAGLGCEVLQASHGAEALEILRENHADIRMILLDWHMPVMDGIAFMQEALKVPEFAAIPIVMCTSYGSDERKTVAYQTNPRLAGYLVKPYKTQQLIDLVRSFVQV